MAVNEGLRNRSDLPIETAHEWSRTEVAWLTSLASAVPTSYLPRLVTASWPGVPRSSSWRRLFFVVVPALHVRPAGRTSSRQPHAELGMVVPLKKQTLVTGARQLTHARAGLGQATAVMGWAIPVKGAVLPRS